MCSGRAVLRGEGRACVLERRPTRLTAETICAGQGKTTGRGEGGVRTRGRVQRPRAKPRAHNLVSTLSVEWMNTKDDPPPHFPSHRLSPSYNLAAASCVLGSPWAGAATPRLGEGKRPIGKWVRELHVKRAAVCIADDVGIVGETPSPLMSRSPRYEPGEGSRAHTQCP